MTAQPTPAELRARAAEVQAVARQALDRLAGSLKGLERGLANLSVAEVVAGQGNLEAFAHEAGQRMAELRRGLAELAAWQDELDRYLASVGVRTGQPPR